MRVMITGGAGFIGSHIAERMCAEGHDVCIVDNLSSGRRENIAGFADQIVFIEGDVRDTKMLDTAAAGCDVIFHLAAVVSVPQTIEDPQKSHDVNIQGTLNVLQIARKHRVKRVVFSSSAAVYGDEPGFPKNETMRPAPISPYGIEKITGEYYCDVFNRHYGVETVALRYFNVFGPRQDPGSPYSGVISIFVDRICAGKEISIYGDGEQYRDFVYVDNVVQANLRAATVPVAVGRIYNIGCGQKTSLNQLAALLCKSIGCETAVCHRKPRPGDIRESIADITRAESELGYRATIDMAEGLNRLVAWKRGTC